MQTITVYPITGRQWGPLRVPSALCEECDLAIRTVRRVVQELGGNEIRVDVKPWLRHLFDALRRGGWHPPVLTIDGKVFSQGVVPDAAALKHRLERQSAPSDDSSVPLHPDPATSTGTSPSWRGDLKRRSPAAPGCPTLPTWVTQARQPYEAAGVDTSGQRSFQGRSVSYA